VAGIWDFVPSCHDLTGRKKKEKKKNKQATRWLGVWIDSKMTLKENHSARMKSARKAVGRIRRLTGQAGLCPGACRKALVACVQATALYGAELWWDDREGAGVKNRRDEVQKLENQLGRAVTGNFRTTNLGVVMAESGLRPAECLLNDRSRRHALRLRSLPKGNQAKSLPGCNTAMGRRMVHFSDYSGRVEEIVLPEEGPTELDAAITVADAAWAKQEARKADGQPGLTLWTDGSRDENGGTGYAVVWRSEEPERRLRPPKERQAGSDSCQGGKANGLTVLSAQVRACPHGCVPEECRQPTGRPLLVVRPG